MEALTPEGFRQDGRRPLELRRMRCRLSVLPAADGSALLDQGTTKVLAAVYGPREVPQRGDVLHDRCSIRCDCTYAAFATGDARRGPRRDKRSIEWSLHLKQLLEAVVLTELLPRSSLHVVVTVLSADGSVRAAVMNAATLALADAGVPLRDTCAASCATVVEGGTPCVDPTHTEESKGPELSVALLPSTGKVPLLLHEGARCGSDAFPQVVDAALGGARAAANFMKAELIRHAQSRAASILEC